MMALGRLKFRRRHLPARRWPLWAIQCCVVIMVHPGFAADGYRLTGRVRDAAGGEPLAGANVVVVGTYLGGSTNARGVFQIGRVPGGPQTLRISFIGYKAQEFAVVLPADTTRFIDVLLQPGAISLGEVVVTASRNGEDPQRATTSVSVLGRDEIRRRNALRLDRALESLPGVNVVGENVNIRNSTGYTRGLGSRVLVLLDGVPVLFSDFGNMNWDLIPATEIERVEVVKGPASALYGAFALGGVMNIISKSPAAGGRTAVKLTAGLYDRPYYDSWRWTSRTLYFNRTDMTYARRLGNWALRLGAGRHQSTGDRVNRDYTRWNATAHVRWQPGSRSELTFFAAYARDRRGEFVWARFDQPYLVESNLRDFRTSLDALAFYLQYRRRFDDRFELKARLSYLSQLTGNQYKVPGDFKPARAPGANVELHVVPAPGLQSVAGLEFKFDAAEQRHFGRHTAYTFSVFTQHIWEPGSRVRLTGSARLDYYRLLPAPRWQTQFYKADTLVNPLPGGTETAFISPQLAASYQVLTGTVVHAAWGNGLRIPSIAERFMEFKVPLEYRGNHQLQTERSRALEFGVRRQIGEFAQIEAVAFSNTYVALIEPVYVSGLTSFYATLVNIQKARVRGIELSGRVRLGGDFLELNGSATLTRPVILDPQTTGPQASPFQRGDLLSYRPRALAYFSPVVRLGAFTLSLDYAYASRLTRQQLQIFKDDQRVPKHQLDAELACRFGSVLAQFIVRNLPNYNYAQIERNLNEVRSFALAITWEQ